MKNRKGFTLIELIIVIAIIAVLAAAIFVAIDPARRLHESRNARRSSDVATILEAVKTFQADNNGTHYVEIDDLIAGNYYTIGTCNAGGNTGCGAHGTGAVCVDLSDIGTNYLADVPMDPSTGSASKTDYFLMKDENGAVTVGACDPEKVGPGGNDTAPDISVSR